MSTGSEAAEPARPARAARSVFRQNPLPVDRSTRGDGRDDRSIAAEAAVLAADASDRREAADVLRLMEGLRTPGCAPGSVEFAASDDD
jgi:hypothetical protein